MKRRRKEVANSGVHKEFLGSMMGKRVVARTKPLDNEDSSRQTYTIGNIYELVYTWNQVEAQIMQGRLMLARSLP
jgi:hypothetical protein